MEPFTLRTAYGDVLVTLQGEHAAYVRAGTSDRDDHLPELELPRATLVSVRVHLKRLPVEDRAYQPRRYESLEDLARAELEAPRAWVGQSIEGAGASGINRRDGGTVTPHMRALVARELEGALEKWCEDAGDVLEAAGRERAIGEARALLELAGSLRDTALDLERQAIGLRAGGRVIYLRGNLTSGANDRGRGVLMPDGSVLLAPEPDDTRSYVTRYLHRGHVRDWSVER